MQEYVIMINWSKQDYDSVSQTHIADSLDKCWHAKVVTQYLSNTLSESNYESTREGPSCQLQVDTANLPVFLVSSTEVGKSTSACTGRFFQLLCNTKYQIICCCSCSRADCVECRRWATALHWPLLAFLLHNAKCHTFLKLSTS